MTAPSNYQSFLARWTRKQSVVNLDQLQRIGSLSDWASNRMITKCVSVHQRQPSSFTRSTPEGYRISD